MRYIWITHTYRVSQKNPLLTLEANISGLTYWEKSDQFWKLCPQLSFEHKNKSILFQHNWEIRFLKSGFKEITGTKTKLIVNMVQVIVIKSKELFFGTTCTWMSTLIVLFRYIYIVRLWYLPEQWNGICESQVSKLCRYCQNPLCYYWLCQEHWPGQVWCAGG